jgi:hypothetical protein
MSNISEQFPGTRCARFFRHLLAAGERPAQHQFQLVKESASHPPELAGAVPLYGTTLPTPPPSDDMDSPVRPGA